MADGGEADWSRPGAERSSASALPVYDLTARKAHQWTMVGLIALGFLLGAPVGAVPLALAGCIMLVGRFWWPADLVRQLVWRVLEPAGLLQRWDAHEDHQTRRVARVLGGIVWLAAAALVVVGASTVGWLLAGIIALMVALDASLDFCALCFLMAQLARRGVRFA
jgi:hypothetical protein